MADSEELADVQRLQPLPSAPPLAVTLERSGNPPTPDLALWAVIRRSTRDMSFQNYLRFLDLVLCGIGPEPQQQQGRRKEEDEYAQLRHRRFLPYNDSDAYRLLKIATEAFVVVNCSVVPDLEHVHFTAADNQDLIDRVELEGVSDSHHKLLEELWKTGPHHYLRDLPAPDKLRTILYLKRSVTESLRKFVT